MNVASIPTGAELLGFPHLFHTTPERCSLVDQNLPKMNISDTKTVIICPLILTLRPAFQRCFLRLLQYLAFHMPSGHMTFAY
jgi:hypothetical protein